MAELELARQKQQQALTATQAQGALQRTVA
jgi:hypothetical protein